MNSDQSCDYKIISNNDSQINRNRVFSRSSSFSQNLKQTNPAEKADNQNESSGKSSESEFLHEPYRPVTITEFQDKASLFSRNGIDPKIALDKMWL